MHQLQEYQAALGVDRVSDCAPGFYLRFGMNPRRAYVPFAERGRIGAFRDDQAGPGTLAVIGGRERRGYAVAVIGA